MWWKRYPKLVDVNTPDTEEIDLDYSVTPLISLLACYFIWLDDDEDKATGYYNLYDDVKNQILGTQTNRTTITVEATRRW